MRMVFRSFRIISLDSIENQLDVPWGKEMSPFILSKSPCATPSSFSFFAMAFRPPASFPDVTMRALFPSYYEV